MATRIEKPEVGKVYWSNAGGECKVCAVDDNGRSNGLYRRNPDKYWECCDFSGWPLYDADPTAKPEPKPLDLSKRYRFRFEFKYQIVSVVTSKEYAPRLSVTAKREDGSEFELLVEPDGKYQHNSQYDLIEMVRRDWTQADVPFPWPVFRVITPNERSNLYQPIIARFDGIRFCDIGIAKWPELARDWEYTTDGKTWQPCCKWE